MSEIFKFGKHEGETIADVCKSDPSYILWAQENLYKNCSQEFIDELMDAKPEWDDKTPKEKAKRKAWLRCRAIALKGDGITAGEQTRIHAEEMKRAGA